MCTGNSFHNGSILRGQPNFRDLGGIPTEDGRTIIPGVLFRSGDLSKLERGDIKMLEKIGIRQIIDFRSDREIIKYPTPQVKTVHENRRITMADKARETAEQMLIDQDEMGLASILIHDYRRLIRDNQDDFREFFRVLTTTECLPLVYHCAAGKDRTGLATYLLLRSLGVTGEVARMDYLQSNSYQKMMTERVIKKVNHTGKNGEILRPMLEVRNEYLDAALEEIRMKFHGLSCYLETVLRVDRQALRNKYTTTCGLTEKKSPPRYPD